MTSPVMQSHQRTVADAITILQELATRPGYRYWPMTEAWIALTAPFAHRILGHQQVTDAYLLGMAVKENGVLVTFDKGIKYIAGAEFSRNLFILH
jgi:predicted nucleic acid-binding protein